MTNDSAASTTPVVEDAPWSEADYVALAPGLRIVAADRQAHLAKEKALARGVLSALVVPGWYVAELLAERRLQR